jgi:putative flippase GtrA
MDSVAHRARFAAVTTAITRRLPFGLADVVAPSLVGYLLINLCTFFVDLGLLGLFHGTFRWPIPLAVTLSYGTASVLSYVLNRVLNFRSHQDVGRQFPVYIAVSVSNYLIFVLGLTDLLSSVGIYYEFSRIIAACCEAVYLYCMLRWVVFRDTTGSARNTPPAAAGEPDTAAATGEQDTAAATGEQDTPAAAGSPPQAAPVAAAPVPPPAE